jgi:hypothetical protein
MLYHIQSYTEPPFCGEKNYKACIGTEDLYFIKNYPKDEDKICLKCLQALICNAKIIIKRDHK